MQSKRLCCTEQFSFVTRAVFGRILLFYNGKVSSRNSTYAHNFSYAIKPMCAEVLLISDVEAGNHTVIDNFKPSGGFKRVAVTVPVKRRT